jgi:predicted transcriptional regulator
MSALSREWFGRLYQETPSAERGILSALARSEEGMHVSDIAKNLGKPLGPVTALTKRLLDSGQIVKIDRGRYMVFSKLYARYVVQRS